MCALIGYDACLLVVDPQAVASQVHLQSVDEVLDVQRVLAPNVDVVHVCCCVVWRRGQLWVRTVWAGLHLFGRLLHFSAN